MKIILASKSPRRKYLLKKSGYQVRVVPSDVEERMDLQKPSYLVQTNAKLKVLDVACCEKKGDVILGADTLIYFQGCIMGKPKNRKQAFHYLQKLQGNQHHVYTGVCLYWVKRKKIITFYDRTKITFKPMTVRQIKLYHKRVNPLDKAGAYAIHQCRTMILDQIAGSYSNVIGLPMEKLKKYLNTKKR